MSYRFNRTVEQIDSLLQDLNEVKLLLAVQDKNIERVNSFIKEVTSDLDQITPVVSNYSLIYIAHIFRTLL